VLYVVIVHVAIIIMVLQHVMDVNVSFGVLLNSKLNIYAVMIKIVTLRLMLEMHADFAVFNVASMLECNLNQFE
jgi:hypothetical protein